MKRLARESTIRGKTKKTISSAKTEELAGMERPSGSLKKDSLVLKWYSIPKSLLSKTKGFCTTLQARSTETRRQNSSDRSVKKKPNSSKKKSQEGWNKPSEVS